jgi:hypothetical protein
VAVEESRSILRPGARLAAVFRFACSTAAGMVWLAYFANA